MKVTTALAATLALGLFAAAPAAAQDRHDQNRPGDRHDMNGDRHDMHGDHHDGMRGDRHMGWHGDRHMGWHGHRGWGHRRCRWTWRHHHHVRVCW